MTIEITNNSHQKHTYTFPVRTLLTDQQTSLSAFSGTLSGCASLIHTQSKILPSDRGPSHFQGTLWRCALFLRTQNSSQNQTSLCCTRGGCAHSIHICSRSRIILWGTPPGCALLIRSLNIFSCAFPRSSLSSSSPKPALSSFRFFSSCLAPSSSSITQDQPNTGRGFILPCLVVPIDGTASSSSSSSFSPPRFLSLTGSSQFWPEHLIDQGGFFLRLELVQALVVVLVAVSVWFVAFEVQLWKSSSSTSLDARQASSFLSIP